MRIDDLSAFIQAHKLVSGRSCPKFVPSDLGVGCAYFNALQTARRIHSENAGGYIPLYAKSKYGLSRTFFMADDMPLAMQIYNHYRKHWLAAYWQQCGIHVVPTLCWSNKQSYEWCFDGEPQHSIVAISSVGTQKSKQNQALFEKGVRAALARLEPSEILWYGKCPEEFDWNVTRIQPYYKRVRRRCENGR